MYTQYIKEIEQRIEENRKKEKNWSFLEYENYKKKYETSVQNTTFYNDKVKDMERETQENLGQLD